MWCPGEIATGIADTVHVVIVRRDSYTHPEARGGGSYPGLFRSILAQDQGCIPAAPVMQLGRIRSSAARSTGIAIHSLAEVCGAPAASLSRFCNRSGCGEADHARVGDARGCGPVLECDRQRCSIHVRHSRLTVLLPFLCCPTPMVPQLWPARHHDSLGSRRHCLLSGLHLQCRRLDHWEVHSTHGSKSQHRACPALRTALQPL